MVYTVTRISLGRYRLLLNYIRKIGLYRKKLEVGWGCTSYILFSIHTFLYPFFYTLYILLIYLLYKLHIAYIRSLSFNTDLPININIIVRETFIFIHSHSLSVLMYIGVYPQYPGCMRGVGI